MGNFDHWRSPTVLCCRIVYVIQDVDAKQACITSSKNKFSEVVIIAIAQQTANQLCPSDARARAMEAEKKTTKKPKLQRSGHYQRILKLMMKRSI